MVDEIKTWLGKNPWPTAAVLIAVLVSLATVYTVSDGEERAELLLGVGSLGGVVLAIMRGLGQRAGSGNIPALLLAVALGGVLSGCGASALQTQARFQLVAGVTLGAAGDVEREIRRAELSECVDLARESQDRTAGEACVLDVERNHAPFHVAHDSSRSALLGWVEIAELAERAGGDEDLVLPSVQAGARWALTYDDVAEALRQLGGEAPPMPPLLRDGLSAVGGAR